tara:strand:- start:204 stop:671 length:468 start_codon:yes stop_codon:yes gene_type:complete
MTQLKLKLNSLSIKEQKALIHYGLNKQIHLDKFNLLKNLKPEILNLFEQRKTSFIEIGKVSETFLNTSKLEDEYNKVYKKCLDKKNYQGVLISKIIRQSSYAVNGNGKQILDKNGQPILISGRVDTKKLKEKYPKIYQECLVPTKSVEVKFDGLK